ncbi:NUDIX domain-containing protein [Streptacidiphilus fuscans]|uniref:NUDIX domain-containing protein n=1 Tax=Streptacidiphilus fuscans TaxID=2789292 RepID=A0A931B7H2_9ACTN|nr:NUDIX domain-containing protein [Streptacidiphilus fuscans]MBF9071844.1 NUDIX domain-containing protein [Streptacidiphilus fuscans]
MTEHPTNRLAVSVIVHDKAADTIATVHYGERSWTAPAWTIPGGKADSGEMIHHAAARELREETGLAVDPDDLTLVHTIQVEQGWDGQGGFMLFVFATTVWSGTLTNIEENKHLDVAWSPVTDLPRPMFPTSRTAIDAYLAGEPAFSTHAGHTTPRDENRVPLTLEQQ